MITAFHDSLRALLGRWQGWVILAVLSTQLLLPLRYYIGHRDPHDERFAWRMFSPMRMAQCVPRFYKDDAVLPLASEFHEAWVKLAERGRFSVIEAMGARLCRTYPGSAIRVDLACTYLDQPPHTYGGFDLCQVPHL